MLSSSFRQILLACSLVILMTSPVCVRVQALNLYSLFCLGPDNQLCLGISPGGNPVYNPQNLYHAQLKLRGPNEAKGTDYQKLRWNVKNDYSWIQLANFTQMCLTKMTPAMALPGELVLRPCTVGNYLQQFNTTNFQRNDTAVGKMEWNGSGQCLTVMDCFRNPNTGFCNPTSTVAFDTDSFDPNTQKGTYVKLMPCSLDLPSQSFLQTVDCAPGCSPLMINGPKGPCIKACANDACHYDNGACATPRPTPPTFRPSYSPSRSPTTSSPSRNPTTSRPSKSPSSSPTTSSPSASPQTSQPSQSPSTTAPSAGPSFNPTVSPTFFPTISPSTSPTTSQPSMSPTYSPTTAQPSVSPTVNVTINQVAAIAPAPWVFPLWLIIFIPCIVVFCCLLLLLLLCLRKRRREKKKQEESPFKNADKDLEEPFVNPEALPPVRKATSNIEEIDFDIDRVDYWASRPASSEDSASPSFRPDVHALQDVSPSPNLMVATPIHTPAGSIPGTESEMSMSANEESPMRTSQSFRSAQIAAAQAMLSPDPAKKPRGGAPGLVWAGSQVDMSNLMDDAERQDILNRSDAFQQNHLPAVIAQRNSKQETEVVLNENSFSAVTQSLKKRNGGGRDVDEEKSEDLAMT